MGKKKTTRPEYPTSLHGKSMPQKGKPSAKENKMPRKSNSSTQKDGEHDPLQKKGPDHQWLKRETAGWSVGRRPPQGKADPGLQRRERRNERADAKKKEESSGNLNRGEKRKRSRALRRKPLSLTQNEKKEKRTTRKMCEELK